MTSEEKLAMLKILLDDGGTLPSDAKLNAYLSLSETEILQWMYHMIGGVPNDVVAVPSQYEVTQIYAVVAGYTHAGSEGQDMHIENGVHRNFKYSDMMDYIHNHVVAIARLGAIT